MAKVNDFKKGKAIVVIEEDGNRIVADYIYSYIYGGTPFINGTPYLDDELIYCSGFLNSKCFKLFSRLKRVVKGRHFLDRYYFYPAPNNKYKYIRITL